MSERVSGNDYTVFCAFMRVHVRSKTVIKSHTSHNTFLDFRKNGITMVSRNKKETVCNDGSPTPLLESLVVRNGYSPFVIPSATHDAVTVRSHLECAIFR